MKIAGYRRQFEIVTSFIVPFLRGSDSLGAPIMTWDLKELHCVMDFHAIQESSARDAALDISGEDMLKRIPPECLGRRVGLLFRNGSFLCTEVDSNELAALLAFARRVNHDPVASPVRSRYCMRGESEKILERRSRSYLRHGAIFPLMAIVLCWGLATGFTRELLDRPLFEAGAAVLAGSLVLGCAALISLGLVYRLAIHLGRRIALASAEQALLRERGICGLSPKARRY
ncbi:hypothetical protein [Cobetia marina]|uniref:hypothetical protein n=1 Tax=Cobetia marina TaxID=28258 RepID=UPI003857C65B